MVEKISPELSEEELLAGMQARMNGDKQIASPYAPPAQRKLTAEERIKARLANQQPSESSKEAAAAILAAGEAVANQFDKMSEWFAKRAHEARKTATQKANDVSKFGSYMQQVDTATEDFLTSLREEGANEAMKRD